MAFDHVEPFFKQGLFMLPEFQFPHACVMLGANGLSESGLQFTFEQCRDFLQLGDSPDLGFTCLVSSEWMFVAILSQPYSKSALGYPVYLDGLAFAGLITLQNEVPVWPATAGLVNNKPTVTKAI
jgi:hypothetical protein